MIQLTPDQKETLLRASILAYVRTSNLNNFLFSGYECLQNIREAEEIETRLWLAGLGPDIVQAGLKVESKISEAIYNEAERLIQRLDKRDQSKT